MSETLAAALAVETAAPELVPLSLAEMYQDPFWDDRFGARGRQFAAEDGAHHLGYLVQALRAGSPETMTTYARWLQSVLTTRGLCSLHLKDNFERLRVLLLARALPGGALVDQYLRAAQDALRYEGDAGALADAGPRLVAEEACAKRALEILASYLADAVAMGGSKTFLAHATWARDSKQSRGPFALEEALKTLRAALVVDELVPAPARVQALEVLDAALAAPAPQGP